MTHCVLGIDTSCYTTSCAAVTLDGQVICSQRKLLPVKTGERGLRQSEAVFAHVRQLPELMEALSDAVGCRRIAAVCVSRTPCDDVASYMPVFQVGDAQGRSLSAILGVPCFASTHQRGHIAAASIDSGIRQGDLLALHLSGGTTDLLAMKNDTLQVIGGSRDLHAGQLVDRAGVAMGLRFPAGPELEELAKSGNSSALLKLNTEQGGLWCHLSGAESQLQRWIQDGSMPRENIAREVYDFLSRAVSKMLVAAARETGIRQALIAGGVASSELFRSLLKARLAKLDRGFHVCFGHPEYSGDNAVGIAWIGAQKLREMEGCKHGSAD